jgi:hypothetical protein
VYTLFVQILRVRVMEEDEGDKEEPADTSQVVKSDDVTFLKRLEKNLLVLQLGGIQDIKKVPLQYITR